MSADRDRQISRLARAVLQTNKSGETPPPSGLEGPAVPGVKNSPPGNSSAFINADPMVNGGSGVEARATSYQSNALLRLFIETAPDAVVIAGARGVILSFSPAAERLFGYSASEVIGKNLSILMPPQHSGRHDAYMSTYFATGKKRIIGIGRPVVAKKKNGEIFPVELAVGEMIIDGERVFTGFMRDITARRRYEKRIAELQNELIHVSRFSAMGELAAALAHELNQPLTAIANYLQAARGMFMTQAKAMGCEDASDEGAGTVVQGRGAGAAGRAGDPKAEAVRQASRGRAGVERPLHGGGGGHADCVSGRFAQGHRHRSAFSQAAGVCIHGSHSDPAGCGQSGPQRGGCAGRGGPSSGRSRSTSSR